MTPGERAAKTDALGAATLRQAVLSGIERCADHASRALCRTGLLDERASRVEKRAKSLGRGK